MVVSESKVSYLNSQAVSLFVDIIHEEGNDTQLNLDELFDKKLFYIFQQKSEDDSKSTISLQSLTQYSLRELLTDFKEKINDIIFTSLKEVVMCDTMD